MIIVIVGLRCVHYCHHSCPVNGWYCTR